jgi:hypothetical protein
VECGSLLPHSAALCAKAGYWVVQIEKIEN